METFQVGFWSMGKTFFFAKKGFAVTGIMKIIVCRKENLKYPKSVFLEKGMGKTFFFVKKGFVVMGIMKIIVWRKKNLKYPQFGFLGKGHGKNLLFPRKEGFSHNLPCLLKNLRFLFLHLGVVYCIIISKVKCGVIGFCRKIFK